MVKWPFRNIYNLRVKTEDLQNILQYCPKETCPKLHNRSLLVRISFTHLSLETFHFFFLLLFFVIVKQFR